MSEQETEFGGGVVEVGKGEEERGIGRNLREQNKIRGKMFI